MCAFVKSLWLEGENFSPYYDESLCVINIILDIMIHDYSVTYMYLV